VDTTGSGVVEHCSRLIRCDTSTPDRGEADAAAYVRDVLAAAGLTCRWFEPEPRRVSLVTRLPGTDASLPPLVVHSHLDTVPAVPRDWTVDPFGGLVEDGYVWGRGAVDMKGMVAATLSVVERLAAAGRRPRRDIVLAFFADEESGGRLGAQYVTDTRPDLFAGCEQAIGEVGGFSHTFPSGDRAFLVATGEKGVLWAELDTSGTAGHGSMVHPDNAITVLSRAVLQLADQPFERRLTPAMASFTAGAAELLGTAPDDIEGMLDGLGPLARVIRAALQDTVNPTTLAAGYKVNVVPGTATATLDGRFLPGSERTFGALLRGVAGDRLQFREIFSGPALEVPTTGPLMSAICAAVQAEDPGAHVLPYLSTPFTDAKWLSRLGIDCYGFVPMLLPADLDFTALFHGVDERVPTESLEFCVRTLERLLLAY
jgi:acetylornithine deacetylase/succinyl-diaminopimelate desuccinylase-like protein